MLARLDGLSQEIIGLEAELERLRALQQSREKDRVALDHEMRKLGEDLSRANSRLSVARLELERLRRDAEKSAEQRERNRAAVEEKERLRAEREAGARSGAAGAGKAGRPGRHHRRRACGDARRTGRTGRAAPRRAQRHGPPGTAVPRDHQPPQRDRAGDRAAGRAARAPAGRQYRAGSARRRSWPSRSPRSKRASTSWRSQDAGMREALRAGEEELKTLRAAVQECAREARRRSKWTWCASRPS